MHHWTLLIVPFKSPLFEFEHCRVPKWAEHMERTGGQCTGACYCCPDGLQCGFSASSPNPFSFCKNRQWSESSKRILEETGGADEKQASSRRNGSRAMDWRMKAVTHNAFWAAAPTGKRVCQ